MTHIVATAPGKAVLSGEYAVLIGAPAIVLALDRRAVVKVKAAADDRHSISTPGFATGSWSFELGDGGELLWQCMHPEEGLPLVEAAFAAAQISDLSPSDFSIDTQAFADDLTGRKYGLGSSAAATTALIASLCQLGGQEFDVASVAFGAHSDFQNGQGSGLDVAASLSGGVVEFQMANAANVTSHLWPDDLHFAVLWSGQPASTRDRVAKFDQSNLSAPSVAALVEAASHFARVWAGQDVARIQLTLGEYIECLHDLDVANALGIFTAGHDLLYAKSKEVGVRYKPCGAGGGDIGIALSLDLNALRKFVDDAGTFGFQELSVAIDWNGVEVSQARDNA